MKYIAQRSARTFVVAGTPGRRAAVSMTAPGQCRARLYAAPILFDQRVEDDSGMLRVHACEMRNLVAARRPGGGQQLAGLECACGREQATFTNLPRHLVVIL